MTLRLWTIDVDAADPRTLARWWADALGWKVFFEDDDGDEVVITTDDERFPGIVFLRVPEGKAVKNRLHLDFVPDDRDAEVDRLIEKGASRVDVGQTGDESWVVLADPEGNEFCVLSARPGGM
ncbi:MAG TPA: VOC family protein [Acidimicrobiia bacterium]|nr:VOC family protein [Acidimicrobiia bacterium]